MPRPPKPWTITCRHCGWHKICAPRSDVFNVWDSPNQCWQCHSHDLEHGELTLTDKLRLLLGIANRQSQQ